jgi:translation elongation factor EF-4
MLSKEEGVRWLEEWTEAYHSGKNDMREVVDDFDEVGKLGYMFSSVDKLEEVDLGDGVTHCPTYINTNLAPQRKEKIIGLLQEFIGCFAWDYTEMPELSRELVEHRLPIKQGFMPY